MNIDIENKLLKLLEGDANLSHEQLAVMLNCDVDIVKNEIERLEKERIILKYKALVNWEKTSEDFVTANIQLKVTPQRGEGFDKIAERIYQYPEVKDVYLVSGGGYDLGVTIKGYNMKAIALFVAEKLACMENVLSTATHFVLRRYKADGIILEDDGKDERRMITL